MYGTQYHNCDNQTSDTRKTSVMIIIYIFITELIITEFREEINYQIQQIL